MDFHAEFADMQDTWNRYRLRDLPLDRPAWMKSGDAMTAVYAEKPTLLQHGTVCYAHIVQANTILFQYFPHVDCPAHIVYSPDSRAAADPMILRRVAMELFRWKDQPPERVPEQWRPIARVITDEYDRSAFTFILDWEGQSMTFHFLPVMIFRKLLPGRKLSGSLLPVIAAPGCRSVLLLPKQYWTTAFRKAWRRGHI